MAGQARGLDLDQARPAAGAGALDGISRSGEDGVGVVTGDEHPGHAVGRRAQVVALDRGGRLLGHRDAPGVVLDDEHHRQLPQCGKIQGFVEGSLVRCAFAQVGHGDSGLTL
ncbi:hypothetical protein D3C87_1640130 [compost metagenome]